MMFLSAPLHDGIASGPCDAKTIAGNVTEQIVSYLIGGVPWSWNMPGFAIPSDVAVESDGSPYELRPDIWWGKHTAVVEVKSGISRYYVTQRQWRSYTWLRDRSGDDSVVRRPRVYYAFVGYKLPKLTRKYKRKHEIVRDILATIEYVAVIDSALVQTLISESGSYDDDTTTPLSPLLGAWHAYHNVTKAKVREWANDPRVMLNDSGRVRWRAPSLRRRYRAMLDDLSQWGTGYPVPPCHVMHPCRPARVWTGPLPGEQVSFGWNGADPYGQ